MNDANPQIPPQIPITGSAAAGILPLGINPEEREPIPNLVSAIEAILRQPRRVILQIRQPGSGRLIGTMLFGVLICSLIYGAVIGSFSMGDQLWAAPVKLAGGLLITGVICLPSLYIFACISGWRDLRPCCRSHDAHDPLVGRICARRVVVFSIDRVARLDGNIAPCVLVYRNVFRIAIPGTRFLSFTSPVERRPEYLDRDFYAGCGSNDDGAATAFGHFGFVPSYWQTVFPGTLE